MQIQLPAKPRRRRQQMGWSERYSGILKLLCCLSLVFLFTSNSARAQDDLKVIQGESSNSNWIHFSDAHNALYHHLAGQAYDLLDKRSATISELNTLSDWQKRQEEVRQTLTRIVGPFPEKTPLNAEVMRTIEKDNYKVEHIIYESQPGFHVTSSLFIPRDLQEQAPAILYLSGHTQDAYRSSTYQDTILNLVKKGFVVFAIDPVGQGERVEYYDPESGSSIVGSATREHSYTGAQAFINGSSLARYMIWDGIRAVDYLHSRDEVDSDRIGITGRSGGGTQAAYIAAFDQRIHAAAPGAFITNFRRLLQSIGPQDAEQNFYHGIAAGIDHADLLEVRAPKPALMINTTEDFFSIHGARETASEVSEIYELYDQPDLFTAVEDSGGHTSTPQNRKAMYAFFQQHLDNPGNNTDQEVNILSDEEIQVTRTGQLATEFDGEGETVFSLNRREAKQNIDKLRSSRENLEEHLPEVLKSAKELSGYQEPKEIEKPVFTGRIQREGYAIEKYFVKGEGDYPIPYLLMIPDRPNGKALLYLHPEGKSAEAVEGGEMGWFVRNGYTVLAPDLIGTGETGPGDLANYTTQVKDFNSTSFDVWTNSVLIGRSITGIRAGDVVRLTRLLKREHKSEEIYGLARQDMSPVLLHAAAFEPSISRVALLEPYSSYRSLIMNRFYDPGLHKSAVAGALKAYDLTDLAAALAPGKLLIAGMTNGAGEMVDINSKTAGKDLEVIKTAYEEAKARDQLTITTQMNNIEELFEYWIEK
ncbi:hypothetical protein Asal01_02585 [Fodinibius salicampi]